MHAAHLPSSAVIAIRKTMLSAHLESFVILTNNYTCLVEKLETKKCGADEFDAISEVLDQLEKSIESAAKRISEVVALLSGVPPGTTKQ